MAISRLTGQDASGTGTTTAVATYPGATTAGNLLIAIANGIGSAIPSTPGGWTLMTSGGASSLKTSLFYKLAAGTETTVSTTSGPGNQTNISIFEYTGNANPIVTDGTAGTSGSGGLVTSFATPAITTTNANDLIFAAAAVANAPNNTSGFAWVSGTVIGSTGGSNARTIGGPNIVSSTQAGYTDTLSWTGSVLAATMIGAFQADSAGATTTSTSSTSSSISTSSTSTSVSTSTSFSTSSTSLSTSTSSTSTSRSTSTSSTSSSTSQSTSTSSTSQSTSLSTSTSSTSSSTSRSTSTSSTSQSTSISTSLSTSSTSSSTSTTISTTTSTSSTSSSTSSTSSSTSSTTTIISIDKPTGFIKHQPLTSPPHAVDTTLVDDPVALVDDPTALVGSPVAISEGIQGKAAISVPLPRIRKNR